MIVLEYGYMPKKNKKELKFYHAVYIRKHYKENKEYYLAKSREQKRRYRLYLQSLKAKPCADCGNTYLTCVMDFDHKPEFEKKYEMAKIAYSASKARITEEAAKCDVVCANCHRIRTHARLAQA